MRTLVTGATGYVGSRLVAALLGEGHHVVVASRNVERLGDFGWIDDVTPVMLDAGDPESVDQRLRRRRSHRRRLLPGARHRATRLPRRRQPGGRQRRARRQGRGRQAHRLPRRLRARRRRTLRAPRQPRRGRRGADHRRRTGRGVARRGDHHRRGVDVVRDAALRRRPLPADPHAAVGAQRAGPDLDQRRALLPGRGRRRRARARRVLRHPAVPRRRRTATCCSPTRGCRASGAPGCPCPTSTWGWCRRWPRCSSRCPGGLAADLVRVT